MEESKITIDSPIGKITICANEKAITGLKFGANSPELKEHETQILIEAKKQLAEYFSGKRKNFDLPLESKGTPFQKKVWQALSAIPYGATACYQDIAVRVGNPKGARAIGMANNRNPIALIVPCHRVIGKNGSLVGFASSIDIKAQLLEHEKTNK